MIPRRLPWVVVVVILGLTAFALAGCLEDLADGNYSVRTDDSIDLTQGVLATMTGQEVVRKCQHSGPIVTCDYTVGSQTISSTTYLIGADSAVQNVVDPLILEVPDNALSAT